MRYEYAMRSGRLNGLWLNYFDLNVTASGTQKKTAHSQYAIVCYVYTTGAGAGKQTAKQTNIAFGTKPHRRQSGRLRMMTTTVLIQFKTIELNIYILFYMYIMLQIYTINTCTQHIQKRRQ